jgi:hypothetical protein
MDRRAGAQGLVVLMVLDGACCCPVQVNTSRAQICDTQAVADALDSGHLAGYAGDVWYPEPAPKGELEALAVS